MYFLHEFINYKDVITFSLINIKTRKSNITFSCQYHLMMMQRAFFINYIIFINFHKGFSQAYQENVFMSIIREDVLIISAL